MGRGVGIVDDGRAHDGRRNFLEMLRPPAGAGSKVLKPVKLPSGFDRFMTIPSPIGSERLVKLEVSGRLL